MLKMSVVAFNRASVSDYGVGMPLYVMYKNVLFGEDGSTKAKTTIG